MTMRVAVIGGGMAGLSAAYTLLQVKGDVPLHVTLFEADERAGGKVKTTPFAGVPVDEGPDAFITRQPWAMELSRKLGLADEFVVPDTGKTHLWTRGRLRSLPTGLVQGVPTDAVAVAKSGILSLPGLLRAGLDLVLPAQALPDDPTVAEVIGSRFGREMVERLVEPLVGGIFAGRASHLSLAMTAPQLAQAARQQRSLLYSLLQLRKQAQPATTSGPAFLSFRQGLGYLPERLFDAMKGELDVRLNTRVQAVTRLENGNYRVSCVDGSEVIVDGLIVAVPAWVAKEVVRALTPAVAAELAQIAYASVIVATLGYRPEAVPGPLQGNGFLVPRVDKRLMTACTWMSSKWEHLRRATDLVIVRCSVGRYLDERGWHISDKALVARLQRELEASMGVREWPVEVRVSRWERAFPQYDAGHRARVVRIERLLNETPGVLLAGAAYHGAGVPACVRDGEQAALKLWQHLSSKQGAETAPSR